MNKLNLLFFAHYFSRLSPCYYYRLFFNIKRQTWGTYHLYGKTGNSGWKINRMVFVNGKHPCLRNRKTLKVVLCTKFCPACYKQVIASALVQLKINFTCIFNVFQIALVASRLGQFCENFENTREIRLHIQIKVPKEPHSMVIFLIKVRRSYRDLSSQAVPARDN